MLKLLNFYIIKWMSFHIYFIWYKVSFTVFYCYIAQTRKQCFI